MALDIDISYKMAIIAEYIWIDKIGGLRSKARTLYPNKEEMILEDFPKWNFDGSSTDQAIGKDSEVIILPVSFFVDPFRENGYLVLCECMDRYGNPIESNHRNPAAKIFDKVKEHHIWFGLEAEYVFFDLKTKKPLGWPIDGNIGPQGKFYCGVGTDRAFGRPIVEEHYKKCLKAGIKISGINAEVMPAQWEFQVGPCEGIAAADQLWVARYILQRVCENYNVVASFESKPVEGYNGSGCHTNFSTLHMREEGGIKYIYEAIEKLSKKHKEHIAVYGDNSKRLCGKFETSDIDKFTYGVADRTASVRIPNDVQVAGCGYCEDRRPSSSSDAYLVTARVAQTILLE